MRWHIYLRRGTVSIPTVAITEAGFYLDVEPVVVVPANDTSALHFAIKQVIRTGNPVVPTPARATFPKPVVLRHVGERSWSAFEKTALTWSITENDGRFAITPGRRRPDRGWEDDAAQREPLPLGATPDDVARRLSDLVQSVDTRG